MIPRVEFAREKRENCSFPLRAKRIYFVWKNGDAFEVELNNHYD